MTYFELKLLAAVVLAHPDNLTSLHLLNHHQILWNWTMIIHKTSYIQCYDWLNGLTSSAGNQSGHKRDTHRGEIIEFQMVTHLKMSDLIFIVFPFSDDLWTRFSCWWRKMIMAWMGRKVKEVVTVSLTPCRVIKKCKNTTWNNVYCTIVPTIVQCRLFQSMLSCSVGRKYYCSVPTPKWELSCWA